MINPLTWLSKRRFPYEPLIKVEISKNRLLHNLDQFRKLDKQNMIAPVLKSNAYGHGLIEIARILEEARKQNKELNETIPFFVLDSYFEALALRSKGIKTPLLIIGYNRPEILLNPNLQNISYAITSIETLRQIQKTKKYINIHLKIDTGMHRPRPAPICAPSAGWMSNRESEPLAAAAPCGS
jgi:alanine racemase